MQRSNRSPFTLFALGIALAIACTPEPIDVPEDDDDDNDNGGSGTGATPGFGGTVSQGGTGFGGSFGGTVSQGGTGVGGTVSQGGTTQTGGFSGTPPTGGVSTGGSFPTGGATTGGAAPTGGATPTGGASGAATGGAAGAGTVSCDATFAVGTDGFVRAPGTTGCWHGYAFAGGDTGSTVMPTSFAMCGMGCMLRASGTVGPAQAPSYAGVVYLGFNVNQPTGSSTFTTLVPAGTGLAVTYTKAAGPATIRVQIQAGSTRWCANLTASPMTIPYTMFNTACWDNSGTAYAKQPIEAVQLVIPGPDAAAGVPFDMTLVSVKDT
jgi:hypothetical protein